MYRQRLKEETVSIPVRLVAPTWALFFFVVFFCLQSPLYIQLIFNLEIKHSSSHYYHCALNTINFLFQEKKYIRAFIQLGPI